MKFQKTSISNICAWLHTFVLVYGFYPFFAGMTGLDSSDCIRFCLIGVLLIIPIIASWWLLRHIHTLWLYLMVGCLLSGLIGFASGTLTHVLRAPFQYCFPITTVLSGGISLILFIVHASAHIRHTDLKKDFMAAHGKEVPFDMKVWEIPNLFTNPQPVHWAWLVLQYIVALILHNSLYWHVLFYMLLCDILVCFAHQSISRFDRFVIENSRTANLPMRTMQQVHHTIFLIALLLIILFALPAIFFGREPLAELAMEDVPIELNQEISDTSDLTFQDIDYDMPLPDTITQTEFDYQPPVWIGYVIRVFLCLLFAIVVIALIIAIIKAARRANATFSETEEDEIIFISSQNNDQRTFLRHKKTSRGERLSVNMQIRKKYKKKIRQSTKGTPNRWATPLELEQAAGLCNSDDMLQLHTLYEKARYSKDGCSKDDIYLR